MTKTDRRVQRTRELLQKALTELIGERGYDALTIQDIVDRADAGRTHESEVLYLMPNRRTKGWYVNERPTT